MSTSIGKHWVTKVTIEPVTHLEADGSVQMQVLKIRIETEKGYREEMEITLFSGDENNDHPIPFEVLPHFTQEDR